MMIGCFAGRLAQRLARSLSGGIRWVIVRAGQVERAMCEFNFNACFPPQWQAHMHHKRCLYRTNKNVII